MVKHTQINKNNTAHKQNQGQKKSHDIFIDTGKACNKIQHFFVIKALMKVRIEGTYLNIIKVIYDKPIAVECFRT
jgi:hypothetical protein